MKQNLPIKLTNTIINIRRQWPKLQTKLHQLCLPHRNPAFDQTTQLAQVQSLVDNFSHYRINTPPLPSKLSIVTHPTPLLLSQRLHSTELKLTFISLPQQK